MTVAFFKWSRVFRACVAASAFAFAAISSCAEDEIGTTVPLPDEKTRSKELSKPTPAEILDASADPAVPDATPHVKISIDGDVYLGAWRKIEGKVLADSKVTQMEWKQLAGPKLASIQDSLASSELWTFLTKPGNYAFTFRAKNEHGWGKPAEIRFAVMKGRPYISEKEGLQLAGSGERIIFPGEGWRQIAGPPAILRPADEGMSVLPNDAGLYVFEMQRLEGLPERRGIRVPSGKDDTLGDRRPVAVMPKTMKGSAGRPIDLDGSLSTDPDTEDIAALKARWSTPDATRGATIEAKPGLHAMFLAERPGMYRADLVVSDGRLDSLPATVFIEVTAASDTTAANLFGNSGSDPLMKRVSLAIWPAEPDADGVTIVPDDSGLERAVQLFGSRCEIGLAINPTVAKPGHFKEFPLALESSNMPLRHFLDGIARQTSTRYRRDGDRAVWLIKAEDAWLEEPLEPAAVGIDALHEKADASDLLNPLMPWLRPLLTRENTSVSFENDRIVAMLPKTASAHLREIVSALREPVLYGVPAVTPAGKDEEDLRATLAQKLVTKRGRFRLDYLLRNLASESGVAMSFDPRVFPKGIPHVKIAYEKTPLRQVLRDLVDEAGFDGCSLEAPSGVWFYKGPRPYPTGESLWETAVVRGYDLRPVFAALTPQAAMVLSGETIAHTVRSRIYPASWNDPGTLVFYHNISHKLIVVHAPEAQKRVVELLNDICNRGEWMLGPSE